ncbi:PEPxxWA-CTERM sorting domain-containing protein [Sphingomonas sp. BT553]|uniref:PEPxxWA-CTERM sorting domain-containing protein n=1 Tax=Sphingomonas mollis TaxID=2795726 RepID=UPI001E41C6CF|nr:PEPxxWA-CTERM sorting domain-containing protein [Sphingomonas sp. BT553]
MHILSRAAVSAAALLVAGTAQASVTMSTVVVTGGTGVPSATSWGVIPSENSAGASAVITSTAPRSGNGSIELKGDRTRFQEGIQYAPFTTNLMPLSSVSGLAFDWRIAADSVSIRNADYTPALRLLVQDGTQRSELIWEGVYNGTYGNTARDTWYSSTFDDNFYQFVTGPGVTLVNGSQVNKSLSSWIAQNYSTNAFVSAISVGSGSTAGTGYHAFADNVSLRTTSGITTFNFEVAAAAVPEPATWAMMLVGFGMTGAAMRYRRRGVRATFA